VQTLTDKLVPRKEGAIGWIIFNNPMRHNAVSLEVWQSLPVVLNAYAQDPRGPGRTTRRRAISPYARG
jgi:enoyl-CoA hydratase/carnithine racemase